MHSYKLVLALKPSMAETDRKKFFETLKSWLKESKIVRQEDLGQKPLSYLIRKEDSGYYVELYLEADSLPLDFEKKLRQTDGVLRHLLLRN